MQKVDFDDNVKELDVFNKYQWALEWPKMWIVTLGILLIFLDFVILSMEIGHTVTDVYRSTAFGGIILFPLLLISSIFVFITAFYPRLVLLRTASVLSMVMIFFCVVLIDYDVVVLVDPSRCFLFDCNLARVQLNSTSYVTGWPLTISWPDSFQTSMNSKRIFQSVQILAAALFILFSVCFLLTFLIYRNIDLFCQSTTDERENSDLTVSVVNQRSNRISPESKSIKEVIYRRSRTNSQLNYIKLCTKCLKAPRMCLSSDQNIFSYLCRNCYEDSIEHQQIKPTTVIVQRRNQRWYDYY